MFAGIVEVMFVGGFRRGIYLKVTVDMLRKTGI